MASSSCEWDACARLLSQDRAVQDVLLRGTRRRYECIHDGIDPAQRVEAWRNAARHVVVTAFADDRVVRLLTEKMQMCKAASEGTVKTTQQSSEVLMPSLREGEVVVPGKTGEGVLLATLRPSNTKSTQQSSVGPVVNEKGERQISELLPENTSWGKPELKQNNTSWGKPTLEQKNTQVLPCSSSCGRNTGVTRPRTPPTSFSEAEMPMSTINSRSTHSVPTCVEHDRGNHWSVVGGCARTAGSKTEQGGEGKKIGCRQRLETSEPISIENGMDIVKEDRVLACATADANGKGDEKEQKDAFNSPCNELSTIGKGKNVVPSPLTKDGHPLFRSRQRQESFVGKDTPAAIIEPTVSTLPCGSTTPSALALDLDCENQPRGENYNAATRNPAFAIFRGAHFESKHIVEQEKSSDPEDASCVAASNSPSPSFESQVERGAALDGDYEEICSHAVAPKDDAEFGLNWGHGQPQDGGISSTTSLLGGKCTGIMESDCGKEAATLVLGRRNADNCRAREREVGDGVAAKIPERTASAIADENRWKQNPTEVELDFRSVGSITGTKPTEEASPSSRNLPALVEQNSLSAFSCTEDEDAEEYEFTFDDDELVADRKTVRFRDESLCSMHEVRASFEQHELGELFYTADELDRMLEEAEQEEALEHSRGYNDEEKKSDDGV